MPSPPANRSVLSPPREQRALSLELRFMLAAMVYGIVVGALIASALWWRLG